jgi:ubiquinone/menaquinone biosynthesis C-methylase UbiE|tara:strand:+ start:207 stop:761 length:555 start_codon:yes stop_codon:yes gene_type:complete
MPTKINKDSFLAAKKLDIYHIISLLPSMPYHEIADIGCAEGALSVPLGKLVYRGNVVSLDPIKKNLTATRRELKKARLTNVKAIHIPDEPILPLKDETLDGAMSAFPFQFFKKPEQTLKDANRCVKKGGWLAVIEWQPEFSDYGPVSKDRVQPTALREKIEKAGFKFYIRHNLSDMAYMMVFSK